MGAGQNDHRQVIRGTDDKGKSNIVKSGGEVFDGIQRVPTESFALSMLLVH
jgi:hypothetical protein